MREALLGAHQHAFVGLVTRRLPYLNRAGRAERMRIVLLRAGAPGNHGAAHAVEVVQVKPHGPHASVNEMAEYELRADDEIAGQLPLNTHARVLGRAGRKIGRRHEGVPLFQDLDIRQRWVGVG